MEDGEFKWKSDGLRFEIQSSVSMWNYFFVFMISACMKGDSTSQPGSIRVLTALDLYKNIKTTKTKTFHLLPTVVSVVVF